MALKRHPTKPGWWQIKISRGRKEKQLSFTFEGTEAEAIRYELDLKRSYRAPVSPSIIPTLSSLIPDFVAYYETISSDGTVSSFVRSWKNLEPVFGSIRPNELSMVLVQYYKKLRLQHDNHRGGTVSKRTINKEISYLSSLINYCTSEESGNLIDPLPFRIKGFPGKQTRSPLPHILTVDEVDAFLAAMPESRRGLCAAMYFAGLRFSEAATLKHSNIDLNRGIIIVRGKGDKERTVPILPELRPYLEGEGDGLLFPNTGGERFKDIRGSIESAQKKAGISKHIHPHLLRHTFGGHGINDISLRAMQSIMGHSTPTMTMRYTQVSEQLLTEQMSNFRQSPADRRKKSTT